MTRRQRIEAAKREQILREYQARLESKEAPAAAPVFPKERRELKAALEKRKGDDGNAV